MRRKIAGFFLCFVLLGALFPMTVYGDMGPKASVRITFENMEDTDTPCYGTLLSQSSSTGPASVWDGTPEFQRYREGDEGYEIWKAFVEYSDSDGFYFLQQWWDCGESGTLNWTYYPPQTFKILLYYPESGTFAVSGIYQKYAFDSYFTVDLRGVSQNAAENPLLVARRSYDYTWELISLFCRIVLTILLELILALLFGLGKKPLLWRIAGVNVVTQVLLNVALNVIRYQQGSLMFVVYYILLEMAVLVLEAVVYSIMLPKVSGGGVSVWKSVVYALVANAASFAAGLGLARVIPGIF